MLEHFTWYKQSAYCYRDGGLTVYIDPWGTRPNDPPADIIFITHAHFDHFQPDEIARLKKDKTQIVAPKDVARELGGDVKAVRPGDFFEVHGIKGQAVPAYNVKEHRQQAHPKANEWVGYVLQLGGQRHYFSGDTDHAPELNQVKADIAFLCIGGDPYVMDWKEAAGLAKAIKPQLAVPNHYGYVVATPADAERFKKESTPVSVETLKPVHAFEKAEATRS
jgi:L-ascorbate metabolism protein UlaG (beta-lactamase superfamily)